MNKSNTNEIASTILIALGGHPFVTMTGAKEFVAEGNALMFKIPRNKSRANHIK